MTRTKPPTATKFLFFKNHKGFAAVIASHQDRAFSVYNLLNSIYRFIRILQTYFSTAKHNQTR